MRIILMGPPGAGKGSEAELLSKQYQIPHISTGSIFRALLKQETTLAKEVASYINFGKLVPDELTNRVLKERLQETDCINGFILDGYPRTIHQAEYLKVLFQESTWSLDAIINLEVLEDVLIERLSGRYVCPVCGATYHNKNKKPKIEGVCDVDGATLIQRKDDQPETVRTRLKVYEKETAPLIAFYQNEKEFMNIDGSKDIQHAHQLILKVLGERK